MLRRPNTQPPPNPPLQQAPTPYSFKQNTFSNTPPMSMHTPTRQSQYQCGVPTNKKQPCRRPVTRPGERCMNHKYLPEGPPSQIMHAMRSIPPAATSTPTSEVKKTSAPVGPVNPAYASNVCASCHYLTAPSTVVAENETPACSMLYMVKCAKCQQSYHPLCLGLTTPRVVSAIESFAWICTDCKICVVCKSSGDESKLMICDDCDRGWHTDCCDPVVTEVPQGRWLCRLCARCHSCENKELDDASLTEDQFEHAVAPPTSNNRYPTYLATYCKRCSDDFEQGRYCPVCLKTYHGEDDMGEEDDMVCCDQCDRWVHLKCDEKLTPELYEMLVEDAEAKYQCPLCEFRVQPRDQTGFNTMRLAAQNPPAGKPIATVGGKVPCRGLADYKNKRLAVPAIYGTGTLSGL
ncbi:uncharacterized protein VTP21DRAFT_8357 [Calcarisporiella thermophila]|uniref:uncharacterized protein n=1 Tax=Calcarisporiella thermophila TaxID=911321 RepID=UPI003742C597